MAGFIYSPHSRPDQFGKWGERKPGPLSPARNTPMIRFCQDCNQERDDTSWSNKFRTRLCMDCYNTRCDEVEADEAAHGCTCRMESVNSASIDPPELIRDEWCQIHGRDPDAEYEKLWDNLHSSKPVPSPLKVKYYGFTKV